MNRSSSTNVSLHVAVPSPSKWNSRSKGTGGKQRRVPLLPFRLGGGRVQQHKCLHWDANLNLKHISHVWITKHFNWTKFHNPKIKVFHIQWLIRQLFGQVDRKRTQFTVPNRMAFLGRRSNLGLTKKKSLTRDYGRRKRFKLSTFVRRRER